MTGTGHLSDDPERLEAFVRGRLAADERKGWDEHLEQCALCGDAVRRERTLEAGIRLAGREEARRRLERRLAGERAPQSDVPWPRIWSIAAAILVLAGLGIVGRWLLFRPGQQESIRAVQELAQKAQPAPAETLTQERGPAPPAREPRAAAPERPRQNPPAGADRAREAAPPAPSRAERNSKDLAEQRWQDSAARDAAAEAADESGGRATPGVAHVLGGGAPGAVHGVTGPRVSGFDEGPKALPPRAESAAPMARKALPPHAGTPEEPVRVVFQPAAAGRQQETAGGGLPALFRRDSVGMHITILIPPEDSALYAGPVHTVRVAADSVVIVTGSRRLGIRIPPIP